VKELGVDLGLLLSQIVNFGLLLALLYAFLYKPVLGKLEERARRIKKGLDDADQAQRLLAEANVRYQEELERARREAREIVERATRLGDQQRQEILAQARQEAHELISRAQQEAQRILQEEQAALQQQVIDLSIAVASRLLEKNLDPEKHHRLIEEFLAEADRLK
jgi:F-type H+-transporting ATPase subunit b